VVPRLARLPGAAVQRGGRPAGDEQHDGPGQGRPHDVARPSRRASTTGDLVFDVTDDGQGIDPSVRDRVVEPFVTTRADGSGPGRGLGLAVVRGLTEAQGGATDVRTGHDGTTVSLRFPLPG
jgi:signal transduction histidine kinase